MSACLAWALVRLGRWAGTLWLCTLLLGTGCATAPGHRGSEDAWQRRARHRELALAAGLGQARLTEGERPEVERGEPPAPSLLPVPEGWPEEASDEEELLAPLLGCPTVGDFLALQSTVDMVGVVERLGDWGAVRLGALGPLVDVRAARMLTRKRASFLLQATRDYGAHAQVFALFIVHTSFDDELDGLLRLLARDKQLRQTLGQMEAVRQELARRGLKLSGYLERGEQASDVVRGLGQAATDALHSSPVSDGARYQRMSEQLQQLPPAYQQAQAELERELMRDHYAPGSAALGAFDQLTFGVPLGFYHLALGTAHGLGALTQGQYEQATRELVPAALLVALYAGGKRARTLSEAEGTGARLSLPEARLKALRRVAWRVAERLGVDGLGELARYIRASREAAVFVGAGGEPAAVALYEARGNMARAQAWLAEAPSERAGALEPKAGTGGAFGGLASLVDEAAGLSAEVVEAKLRQAELEAPGPRLPADVALLHKLRATLSSPPPGVPEGYALWEEYLSYRQRRLAELEQGRAAEGPLRWDAYEHMRGAFARGLAFERAMVEVLRADAALPLSQRQWLRSFSQPRVEVHVGVSKQGIPGRRFADVLVIEEQPASGQAPRVETFSFKSRYLAPFKGKDLGARVRVDAQAALDYYGGTLDILRSSLRRRVQVQHVRLVYQGGGLLPKNPRLLQDAVREVEASVKGVEVLVR